MKKSRKLKMSAGELLAAKLNGDASITNEDIANATKNFFESRGVKCTITSQP